MSDQLNGPGFHLSLADESIPKLRKLTARQQKEADKQSADLAKWVDDNWVPCAKCGNKHPPEHGSHCIVCAVHTPESEQRSHWRVGPAPPNPHLPALLALTILEMLPTEVDTRQVKVAICQHCQGWVMVGCFPESEKRTDSRREWTKCINAGNEIKVVPLTDWNTGPEHEKMCMGHKKVKKQEPSLFAH